jgi:hypothetical protein
MIKFVWLAVLAAVATAVATPAFAAAPVTQQATSRAKILKALQLTKNDDLDFGTVIVGAVVGTETVSVTQSGRTCGNGVGSQLVCNADPYSPASFNVTGTNNQLVTITVPSTVTMTNGATGSLDVDLTAPANLTLTSSGSPGDDFFIEGSVDLAASTEEGDYTVDFDVTVEY